jgi:hypothetical protein
MGIWVLKNFCSWLRCYAPKTTIINTNEAPPNQNNPYLPKQPKHLKYNCVTRVGRARVYTTHHANDVCMAMHTFALYLLCLTRI